MNGHTPGPWEWRLFEYSDGSGRADDFRGLYGPNGRLVAHGYCDNMEEGHIGCEPANARLIAAAPDLLEATLTAWHYLNSMHTTGPTLTETEAALQKAIEKARGKS